MRKSLIVVMAGVIAPAIAADLNDVKKAEAERIAVVARVRPAVTAVFSASMEGGGSGVVIDADGYALTNFHVVGDNKALKCGLADGVLYDAVLVGLDKIGDVDLLRMPPNEDITRADRKKCGTQATLDPTDVRWSVS